MSSHTSSAHRSGHRLRSSVGGGGRSDYSLYCPPPLPCQSAVHARPSREMPTTVPTTAETARGPRFCQQASAHCNTAGTLPSHDRSSRPRKSYLTVIPSPSVQIKCSQTRARYATSPLPARRSHHVAPQPSRVPAAIPLRVVLTSRSDTEGRCSVPCAPLPKPYPAPVPPYGDKWKPGSKNSPPRGVPGGVGAGRRSERLRLRLVRPVHGVDAGKVNRQAPAH